MLNSVTLKKTGFTFDEDLFITIDGPQKYELYVIDIHNMSHY